MPSDHSGSESSGSESSSSESEDEFLESESSSDKNRELGAHTSGALQPMLLQQRAEQVLSEEELERLRQDCPPNLINYFNGVTLSRNLFSILTIRQQFGQAAPTLFGSQLAAVDDSGITRFLFLRLCGHETMRVHAIHDSDDWFKALLFLYKYLPTIRAQVPDSNYVALCKASKRWSGLALRLDYLLAQIFTHKRITEAKDMYAYAITAMNAGVVTEALPNEKEWQWACHLLEGYDLSAADKEHDFSIKVDRRSITENIYAFNALFWLLNRLLTDGAITGLTVKFAASDIQSARIGGFAISTGSGISTGTDRLLGNLCHPGQGVVRFLDPVYDSKTGGELEVTFTTVREPTDKEKLLEKPAHDCWHEWLCHQGLIEEAINSSVVALPKTAAEQRELELQNEFQQLVASDKKPFSFGEKTAKATTLKGLIRYLKKGAGNLNILTMILKNAEPDSLSQLLKDTCENDSEHCLRAKALLSHILEACTVSSKDHVKLQEISDALTLSPTMKCS